MADPEALDAPGGNGAVSGEALDSGRREMPQALDETPIVVSGSFEPRRCIECRQPLEVGDRKLHRGACQRARKTRLWRLARWRRRR